VLRECFKGEQTVGLAQGSEKPGWALGNHLKTTQNTGRCADHIRLKNKIKNKNKM